MKKLIFILFILMISSCVTRKACNKKFPPTQKKDSVYIEKEVIRYKDTTIYIRIKADTVYKNDTVYITKDGAQSQNIESDLPYSYAKAYVQNGRIYLIHQVKDTIIQQIIENAIRESEKTNTTTVTKTEIKEIPVIPWWAKILMWLSLPTIIYAIIKLIKILV